jgi:hypothetical protein
MKLFSPAVGREFMPKGFLLGNKSRILYRFGRRVHQKAHVPEVKAGESVAEHGEEHAAVNTAEIPPKREFNKQFSLASPAISGTGGALPGFKRAGLRPVTPKAPKPLKPAGVVKSAGASKMFEVATALQSSAPPSKWHDQLERLECLEQAGGSALKCYMAMYASDNDPDHTIAQEGAMLASARAHNQGSEKWHKVAHKMHTRAAILSKTAGDEEGAMIHLQHADMHAAHFKH